MPGQRMTYPQEAFQVDAAGVQGPVQMVHRIFDRVVLSDEVDQPEIKSTRQLCYASGAAAGTPGRV